MQQIMGLSSASVNRYLPYNKTVYKMEEATLTAERLRKFRQRMRRGEIVCGYGT